MQYPNHKRRNLGAWRAAGLGALALAGFASPGLAQSDDSALSSAIQRALEEEHYDAIWQVGTPFEDVPAGWQAPNKAANLRTFFLRDGVRIMPRVGGVSEWSLSLSLRSLTRGTDVRQVTSGEVVAGEDRVEVRRAGIVEWYENDERGLEQGFDLTRRHGGDEGELELLVDVEGELEIVDVREDEVDLAEQDGEGRVSMNGLFAFDANGMDLPVRFERRGEDLAVVVDDSGAQYPITIDPIIQNETAELTVTGPAPDGKFGEDMDIEGDRALIGSPGHNNAYLFERVGGQWEIKQKFATFGPVPGSNYGSSVALTDTHVLISAYREDAGGQPIAGRVYSYDLVGSSYQFEGGFEAPIPQHSGHFGFAIDADHDWLAVGSPRQAEPELRSGAVHIYQHDGDQWNFHQELNPPGDGRDFFMGTALALHGNDLVVGSPGAGNGAGHVEAFRKGSLLGIPVWTRTDTLTSSGSVSLGHAVDFDGNQMIAGAPMTSAERGIIQAWIRIGGNWEPEGALLGFNSGDRFGSSVAITDAGSDGPRAVVGAPFYLTGNVSPGAAYILAPGQVADWVIDQILTPDLPAQSWFGAAVAIDFDTALICAPNDRLNGVRVGSVTEYELSGIHHVEKSVLYGKDRLTNDEFGHAVAVEGDIAVVGVPNDDDSAFGAGGVHIFEREGQDWKVTAKLKALGGSSAFDKFGSSVAVHGTTVLVGAPFDEHSGGIQSGAAYYFAKTLTGTWNAGMRLQPLDPHEGAEFGASVAMDGDALLIGAPGAIGSGPQSGAAYVFRKGFSIQQEAKLFPQSGQDGDRSGQSVDLSGDRAVLGAPNFGLGSVVERGRTLVFERSGTFWTLNDVIDAASFGSNQHFGTSVAVRGDRIVVGAPQAATGGHVVVYDKTSSWLPSEILPAPASAGAFGHSVSLGEGVVAVGAPEADIVGTDSGAAYLYLENGNAWIQVDLEPTNLAAGDRLGTSVSVDGEFAVVGAPRHTVETLLEGTAYVMEVPEASPFARYGVGNGSEAPCPCGNESQPGAEEGCANSTGVGSILEASGTASLATGDLGFVSFGMPANQPALLFMGDVLGTPAPFGDGLLATGGFIVRQMTRNASSGGAIDWPTQNLNLNGAIAGDVRYFQVWYRDPVGGGTCGSFFNLSSGVAVTFQP